MPNQVAVRAAGDCGALPDDDSYEFVFYRNPTPIWFTTSTPIDSSGSLPVW